MKKILLLIFLLPLALTSCLYDTMEELSITQVKDTCTIPAASDTVSFTRDIQPIFTTRCGANNGACHDASNAISAGGSAGSFANYTDATETVNDRGTADFIQRITHEIGRAHV